MLFGHVAVWLPSRRQQTRQALRGQMHRPAWSQLLFKLAVACWKLRRHRQPVAPPVARFRRVGWRVERSCEAFLQFGVALAVSRLGVGVTVRPHTAPLAAYTHAWFIQVDMWRATRRIPERAKIRSLAHSCYRALGKLVWLARVQNLGGGLRLGAALG